MAQCDWLANSDGRCRRTVADAIDLFRTQVGFGEQDYADCCAKSTSPIEPHRRLIVCRYENCERPVPSLVSLPAVKYFKARSILSQTQRVEIDQLHGAKAFSDGTVVLTDGTQLRALEVIPKQLPLKPTDLDWRHKGRQHT
jgi:hypothetical protein